MAAALSQGSTSPAAAAGPCTVAPGADLLDAEEQEMVRLVNQYRAQHGVAPVQPSTNLMRSATWMSEQMAAGAPVSHTDVYGRNSTVRAQDCGYPFQAGENLAAGTAHQTAKAAFDLLLNSPPHAGNMLLPFYVQVGVARVYNPNSTYHWYWTQVFGTDNDGTTVSGPPPVPTATPVSTLALPAGANLVTWSGHPMPAADALKFTNGKVDVVYGYDAATKIWLRFSPSLDPSLNTLTTLQTGRAYWFLSSEPTQLPVYR
jgi:uncharacterized protein YkwD